jgi:beta-glucanase (GH16 family)
MKTSQLITILVALAGISLARLHADPPGGASGWQLSLNDDFNSFDTSKWSRDGVPWWNSSGQLFYYAERFKAWTQPQNVTVSNGLLRIDTKRESKNGYSYTAGHVSTAGKFVQLYGYFECRAKFPTTKGCDPAFWLTANRAAWPPEVDIVELPGKADGRSIQFNVHWREADGTRKDAWKYYTLPSGRFGDAFRTYGLLWEPGLLVWYIDGVERYRVTQGVPTEPLVINLSAEVNGGPGDGFYDDPAQGSYPLQQQIDWVRVWKRSGLANGTYQIISRSSAKVADVSGVSQSDGARIHSWTYGGSANQKWKFERQTDGAYRITATHSGKALEAPSGASGGVQLEQRTWNGGDHQRWNLASLPGGFWRITNKRTGLVMDLRGSGSTNGTPIQQYWWNGSNAQQWKIAAP